MKIHFIVLKIILTVFFTTAFHTKHSALSTKHLHWQPLAESNRSYLDENQMS